MILKFYAKGAKLVRVPGAQPLPNQPDMYVGRSLDHASRGYRALPDPYEVDSASAAGQRLARLVRLEQSLYAADQATADHCGVKYVPVYWQDGAFVEKIAEQKSAESPKKPSQKQES